MTTPATSEEVRDLLLILGDERHEHDIEEIESWTPEYRQRVIEWAANEIAIANDNDGERYPFPTTNEPKCNQQVHDGAQTTTCDKPRSDWRHNAGPYSDEESHPFKSSTEKREDERCAERVDHPDRQCDLPKGHADDCFFVRDSTPGPVRPSTGETVETIAQRWSGLTHGVNYGNGLTFSADDAARFAADWKALIAACASSRPPTAEQDEEAFHKHFNFSGWAERDYNIARSFWCAALRHRDGGK
jgi:hypothetical protein